VSELYCFLLLSLLHFIPISDLIMRGSAYRGERDSRFCDRDFGGITLDLEAGAHSIEN
jgi:hypothetical protein